MKKLKCFLIVLLAIFVISATFSLCSCNKNKIGKPTNLTIEEFINPKTKVDGYKLVWGEVKDAKSYVIEIKNVTDEENVVVKTDTTKNTEYNLTNLETGDYDIRVKSVPADKNRSGDWSVTKNFKQSYRTGCIYQLINNGTEYEITKIGTAKGTVTIDEMYRNKPVTRIADAAFRGSSRIEEIYVADSITEIGDSAFYNCSKLKIVELPNNLLSLGEASFQACRSLESIAIPEGITEIKNYTFYYCKALKNLTLSDNITTIADNSFESCTALEAVNLPNSVTYLGEKAFCGCSELKSVTFGANLKTIAKNTFAYCSNLETVNFSEEGNLESIGEQAFIDCKKIQTLNLPQGVKSIGYECFYNNELLEDVIIPETVEKVGAFAFYATKLYQNQIDANENFIYADKWLVSVKEKGTLKAITDSNFKDGTLGIADRVFLSDSVIETVLFSRNNSIRHIGEYAFAYCNKLWKFRASENLLTIDDYAFMNCTLLSNLLINNFPDMSLEKIGDQAFINTKVDNSSNEDTQLLPESIRYIGTNAFKNTDLWKKASGVVYAGDWVVGVNGSVTNVVLKEGVRGIGKYAFYKCNNLISVAGLQNVQYINYGAFYCCESLRVAPISSGIETIEDFTFYKCSSLMNFSFSDTIKHIGRSAFYKCEGLGEIDLSNTWVETIGMNAFYGCSSVTDVKLSTTTQSIGDSAFYNNVKLKSVVIPNNVTSLGEKVFANCKSLQTITIGSGLNEIKTNTFKGCVSLSSVTIPENVKSIGNYAFYKCSSITSLNISEGVEVIGNYAFYGLENLKNLTLPKTLNNVGSYAFKGAKNLNSINISSDVKQIGAHAFYGCVGLTIYTDAESILGEWHSRWNSSYRPVIWNVTLNENNEYVESVVINAISNKTAQGEINAPYREGYTFLGWAIDNKSEEVVFEAKDIILAEQGVTLYAVWSVTEL